MTFTPGLMEKHACDQSIFGSLIVVNDYGLQRCGDFGQARGDRSLLSALFSLQTSFRKVFEVNSVVPNLHSRVLLSLFRSHTDLDMSQ